MKRDSRETDPSLRRLLGTCLVGALLFFHLFVFVSYFQWRLTTPTSVLGSDLRAFYTSWRIVLNGRASEMYNIGLQLDTQSRIMGHTMTTDSLFAFVNPPYVSLAFAWLGFVRVEVAYALFSIVQLLCFAIACRIMLRGEMVHWTRKAQVVFLASGVLSIATLSAITLGTFTPMMFLAVVAIGAEYRSALHHSHMIRHWRIGIWLCVLTIKPQLAVFVIVALIGAKQWRVLRSAAVIGLGVVSASSMLCGPRIWIRYAELLRTYGGSNGKFGGDSHYMWNLRGVLTRVQGFPTVLADQVSSALFVVGIFLFGYWVRRAWSRVTQVRDASSDFGRGAMHLLFERIAISTLTCTVLLTPHCNRQDTLLLLPAVIGLVGVRRRRPTRNRSNPNPNLNLLSPNQNLLSPNLANRSFDWFVTAACTLSAVALMWGNDPNGFALHPITLLALVTAALVLRIRGNEPERLPRPDILIPL